MHPAGRAERQHSAAPSTDRRNPFQKDRDRVQYSSAFHRLAGVTQIVRAGEAGIFHTRQQHTYKVAQIGRRLAEGLTKAYPEVASKLAIDPEVVEAASLAHDLGHPPFGHAGEHELNRLVESFGDPDGFEGNAQTFRILTRLAVRHSDYDGLDLTRATLAASLKYPWTRDKGVVNRATKWGAYAVDAPNLLFARLGYRDLEQAPEAAIMDWADDISYSIHDLEDFHRVGAIPWSVVLENMDELVANAHSSWFGATPDELKDLEGASRHLAKFLRGWFGQLLQATYDGRREQRVALRTLTSHLIGRMVDGTRLEDTPVGLVVDRHIVAQVKLLKQIAKDYITSSPALVAQQYGQKRIIADLFRALVEVKGDAEPRFLPFKLRYLLEIVDVTPARFAADCISSMTEHEVVALHGRLFGSSAGSVLDPIVR